MTGGTALTGRVRVTGAKNSALKLMAAALLAAGPTTIEEVPDILDVAIMSEVLRRLGCDVHLRADAAAAAAAGCGSTSPSTRPPRPTTTWCAGCGPRSACSGPLVARCGSARVALPGGDAIGSRGLDMHIAGLERLGADHRQRARLPRRHRPAADRHVDLAGLPLRRRHREPDDGRGAGRGHDGHRQRGARAGDRRPLRDARRDGRPDRRRRHLHRSRSRASTRCRPVTYTTVPDRIVAGTWAIGAVMTRGDVVIERAVADHLAVALDKLTDAGAQVETRARRLPGRDGRTGPARRRRDAALSRASRPTCSRWRSRWPRSRRDGADHRERVRGPLHVRQRAGAARRRRAHRRPPRRRPRPRAALQRAGAWPPTSAPARGWCWPGWSPTASPRCRTCTTSTAAIPDFVEQLRGLGAKVERTKRRELVVRGKVTARARARSASSGKTSTSARSGPGSGSSTGCRRRRAPPAAPGPTPGGTAWRSG